MPTLREVQAAFAQSLLTGEPSGTLPYLVDDHEIAPADRMGVYRNTFVGTLVAALRITYPAIERLVGEKFFEGAATRFVRDHVPHAAHLNTYGGDFGDFLAGFAPAASLPYLPDVARLEWAVSSAANAPDALPLDPAALGSLSEADQGRIKFQPHPSVRIVHLAYDADRIRKAVIDKNEAEMAGLAPDATPFWLIAHRKDLDVVMRRLTDDEARFSQALMAGGQLDQILAPDGMEAQIALLGEHLATGRFAGYSLD
ncbi:MAG TPA: DNA-binding domain-containing protein [Magnetospirillaceae bacterium]